MEISIVVFYLLLVIFMTNSNFALEAYSTINEGQR